MNSYTAEAAGRAVKDWSYTRERLARRLDKLALAIDLDTSCRGLENISKKRIGRLISEAHMPAYNPQTPGRFPDPAVLLLEVARLREAGERGDADRLSTAIREIRLLMSLAQRMSHSAHPVRA